MKPKVLKPQQQTTNEQRRHALGLAKTLPPMEQEKRMTMQIGASRVEVQIRRLPDAA